MDVAELKNSPYKVKLVNSLFQIELERFVEREGFLYDRLLSKWAIFKEEAGQNLLVSHARYVDEISLLNIWLLLRLCLRREWAALFLINIYLTLHH